MFKRKMLSTIVASQITYYATLPPSKKNNKIHSSERPNVSTRQEAKTENETTKCPIVII